MDNVDIKKESAEAKKTLSSIKKRRELFKMTIQPELFYQKLAEKLQYETLLKSGRSKLTEDEYYNILDEVEEEKKKIDAEPLVYFCPNLEQERMITAFVQGIRESKVSTILITSANGTGKTTLSINLLGNLIFGVQNKWFDYPEIKRWAFPKQIWLITTPSNINSNYFSENLDAASLNYWFKGKRFVTIKNGKNYITKVTFPDRPEWTINIYTYYQEPKEFESATVGLMLLDEPSPEHIWRLLPSRVRKGGVFFLPMTPLDCDPYIKDDVMDKASNNVRGYKHIEASAFAVTTDKERGHLDKDVLNAQIEKYNEDEIEARVYGRLMFFKERIIPNWNPAIHFVPPEKFPIKKDYLIFHVFDPADGRPNAEIWGAITPEGRKIIFGEMPILNEIPFWDQTGGVPLDKHMLNVEFYESTLESELGFPLKVKKRIVDYHFANQTRGTFKTNLLTDYRKAGWRLFESYKGVGEDELPYGHRKIIDALRIMPDGYPGLVVWNTCVHVGRGFEKYVRKRAKTESDMMKPANSGKIIEKYKDFMDVVRYFVCDSGRIFEVEDETYRKPTINKEQNANLHNIYNLF